MTLKKIIEGLRSGNSSAEKQLFLKTKEQLMAVAIRYVPDESAARDILQESYIRIFRNIKSFDFRGEASALSWMRQVTSREAIRWLNRQRRWAKNDVDWNSKICETHPMFKDDMYRSLLQLPEDQRLVFNMKAIEGFSHKEIAKKLNIAESSSRSLLTRARKNLIKELKKQDRYVSTK